MDRYLLLTKAKATIIPFPNNKAGKAKRRHSQSVSVSEAECHGFSAWRSARVGYAGYHETG